jgi:hypoxanthine phosphoribosyltransferase
LDALTEEKAQRLPFELLLDQNAIARKVKELGRQITEDYTNEVPVLLGVLKGCVVFLSDLMRTIKLPLEIEFVSAASYRRGMCSQEDVVLGGATTIPLKGRHVLVVEGVVDTGRTVSTIVREIKKLEPASVKIVTLLDKPGSHRSRLKVDYRGFSIGNDFVIGYGLDNTQRYRNLPFIGRVVES